MSRTGSRSIPMRVSLSAGESYYQDADAQHPSSIDIWLMAKNNQLVEEALQYYAMPHTWFSLRKICELILRDVKEAEKNNKLQTNTWNTWAHGWVNDFRQTANSYHLSGLYWLQTVINAG